MSTELESDSAPNEQKSIWVYLNRLVVIFVYFLIFFISTTTQIIYSELMPFTKENIPTWLLYYFLVFNILLNYTLSVFIKPGEVPKDYVSTV
jgi:hypothetical protein